MNINHHLIIVPGLGSPKILFKLVVQDWRRKGYNTTIFLPEWQTEETFETKLDRFVKTIDKVPSDQRISLIGTSAGGSLVLNALALQQQRIHKMINICGRLRAGVNISPSLEKASMKSKSFYDSVKLAEKSEAKLTSTTKQKIQTIRPYYDEIVPVSTMTIDGAENKRILAIEHIISISLAMTVYFDIIDTFLKK